jgi:hypothetical protein
MLQKLWWIKRLGYSTITGEDLLNRNAHIPPPNGA